MKKIWENKTTSFKKAAEFDNAYYMRMSKADRISTMQFLREIYYKIRPTKNADRKRLRRVIKVI